MSVGGGVWAWERSGAESSPDHRKEDGIATDMIHQKEKPIVAEALLTGLKDDAGHVGQGLWGRDGVGGSAPSVQTCPPAAHMGPQKHLYQDHDPKDLVGQNILDKGPAGTDQGNGGEEDTLQPGGRGGGVVRWGNQPFPPLPATCPAEVTVGCDVVHDSEASEAVHGVALAVDKVVVDLEADRWTVRQGLLTGGWWWFRNTNNHFQMCGQKVD